MAYSLYQVVANDMQLTDIAITNIHFSRSQRIETAVVPGQVLRALECKQTKSLEISSFVKSG